MTEPDSRRQALHTWRATQSHMSQEVSPPEANAAVLQWFHQKMLLMPLLYASGKRIGRFAQGQLRRPSQQWIRSERKNIKQFQYKTNNKAYLSFKFLITNQEKFKSWFKHQLFGPICREFLDNCFCFVQQHANYPTTQNHMVANASTNHLVHNISLSPFYFDSQILPNSCLNF
jgi:hypothetical protein